MAVKTLLVGLGGTGCKVVTRVMNLINTTDPNVQFVGFDTDGGGEGCEGLPLIFTSREMSVKQYLNDMDNWQDWFPDNPLLKARNMIKGAGQVRPLSRLAFAETISSGRLGLLEQAIRALHVSRGTVEPSNFRIMIVSSFAGGTGSGMFIQMALFLRDYIRKHYGGEVIVRGLFAMPDLFMGVNPSKIQKESMYANAYAALKELNAINAVCLSNDPSADEINMQIDGLFDSKRDRKVAEKKPFDFIFFVDNINARGMVLESTEDYMDLLTTATHMQVYSPITDNGDSKEDNAILTLISGDGKPLYGSVGAAKIVYPYQDIVDYCGIRATIESIDSSWSVVDTMFRKADLENKKQMAFDSSLKPLNRQAHFISTVNDLLEEGDGRLNFISQAMTTVTKDGRRIDRVESYYDSVYQYTLKKLKSSDETDLTQKADDVGVTEKQLKANLVSNVVRNETALKDYIDTVNSRIALTRASVTQSIIPDQLGSAINLESEWNIMQLVTINSHIVHPLAVRMLLYKFRALVAKQCEASTANAASLAKQINKYFKDAYDIAATGDHVETAIERASDKGLFDKIKFRSEYLVNSAKQKTRIEKYRDEKMLSVVFNSVLKRLDALIKQYERLFDSLDGIKAELQAEVDNIEQVKHANTAEPTIYLCADPDEKKDLYDSLSFNCSNSNDNGVYDNIFTALYQASYDAEEAAKAKLKSKKAEVLEEKLKMSTIFRESIVQRNIADIAMDCSDALNKDVYQALKIDCDDDAKEMFGVINSTFDKALPYLKHTMTRRVVSIDAAGGDDDDEVYAYTLTFWGIHPSVKNRILQETSKSDIREFFKAGPEGDIPEVVADDEYSKYEISCYEALYCVALHEIPKFAETGDSFGVFYENYSNRIRKMLKKEKTALTPHLDIRWHSRSYLPMISGNKNREDDLSVARAMWLALIYGGLPESSEHGDKFVYAFFARTDGKNAMLNQVYENRNIMYKGKHIQISNVYELFKALRADEITVERFKDVYEDAFENDRSTALENMEFVGARARRFVKKLVSNDNADRNALNMIARFVSHAKATDYEKKLFVESLQNLIEEFCAELTYDRQAELRKLIFKSSRFGKSKTSRAKLEQYINFAYWEGIED